MTSPKAGVRLICRCVDHATAVHAGGPAHVEHVTFLVSDQDSIREAWTWLLSAGQYQERSVVGVEPVVGVWAP